MKNIMNAIENGFDLINFKSRYIDVACTFTNSFRRFNVEYITNKNNNKSFGCEG